jgi:hypothetical protein
MGHHVHALPPPIIGLTPKTEKPRSRPRLRAAQEPDGAQAADEGDQVSAAAGPLDENSGRRPVAGRRKAAPAPQRGGLTAQALTDDTLRTLLIGQENALNGSG